MEAAFCVETLEDAMARHGKPDIFNTDQGSQFTGSAFTGALARRACPTSFLTTRHRAEPDPAPRNADGLACACIDGHRRADNACRRRGNCRRPLSDLTR